MSADGAQTLADLARIRVDCRANLVRLNRHQCTSLVWPDAPFGAGIPLSNSGASPRRDRMPCPLENHPARALGGLTAQRDRLTPLGERRRPGQFVQRRTSEACGDPEAT